jgi:hypothetical protein
MALSADPSDGPAADRIERAMPIAGFVADRFLIDQMLRATRRFGGDFEALVVWSVLGHLNVAHLESPASPPAGAPADSPWPGAALRPMRLRDLSRICGIPRETVRRKLAALQREEPGLQIELVASNALDNLLRRDAELFQKGDHLGMAEVAAPAEAHDLPAWARFRHGDHAGPAAPGIAANRHWRLCGGRFGRAEQTVGQLFCSGGRGKGDAQQENQDTTHSVSPSPFGLTQSSRIRPRANRRIKGVIPQGWLPVSAVTRAIDSGAMKDVAVPASAYRPKASVMRAGSAWTTIMVRLEACKAPPAAPISAPRT